VLSLELLNQPDAAARNVHSLFLLAFKEKAPEKGLDIEIAGVGRQAVK
jgi:hypothetical protein